MDLKIKDVAELLQISETTVRRWLADGKIPAYKLNSQYRFNREEIEDWVLKQRVETKQEQAPVGNLQFNMFRAIHRGLVTDDLPGTTKKEIIEQAMERMASHFDLDAEMLTQLLLEREEMMSTAIDGGVAVPHTRELLFQHHFDVLLVVYPQTPLDYGALDGKPVHTLFFLFAHNDKHHLNLLSKVAHFTKESERSKFLQTKPTKELLLDCVKQWETTLN